MRHLYIAVLLLLTPLVATDAGGQPPDAAYVLVAHPDVVEESCDKRTFGRIFLGKKTVWDDGTPIVPVVQGRGSLHKEFVKDILERSVARYEAFWKQAVFTGRGIPPHAFDDEEELLAYVAETPGAVGYVSASTPRQDVKLIICK